MERINPNSISMKLYYYLFLIIFAITISCSDDFEDTSNGGNNPTEIYFPPIGSDIWETVSLSELEWNENNLQPLLDFVEEKNSKAFIILKDGKIAVEWYGNDFTQNENHTWNSAAKTLSALTIGIAQQEGLLDIHNPSRDYLGNNWSSLSDEQEEDITVWHHLTMTTGLDYDVANANCTEPEDLVYKNEPETYWYYHNAPYTLTHSIVEGAVNMTFSNYFNTKIKGKIGMQGIWFPFGCYKLFTSNARSMARFGLLNLNKGKWDTEVILNDTAFFTEMTNTTQDLNKAYGYLWWLNGKDNFRLPTSEEIFNGELIPNAPNDMFAGLGKDDQKLYVVPSENLVIVRFGDNAGTSQFGPSSFDNELWEKINAVID